MAQAGKDRNLWGLVGRESQWDELIVTLLGYPRQLTRLLELAPVALAVADRQGRIVAANLPARQILGHLRGTVHGLNPLSGAQLYTLEHKVLSAEELPLIETLTSGKTMANYEFIIEYRNGDQKIVAATARPVYSSQGEIRAAVATLADITDRKIAECKLGNHKRHLEEAIGEKTRNLMAANRQLQQEVRRREKIQQELSEREVFLKTLLDNSPNLVIRLDRSRRVIFANEALGVLTGRAVESFLGKTLQAFEARSFDTLDEEFDAVLRTGETRVCQVEHAGERKTHFFEVQLVPEKAADGSVQSVLGIGTDITDGIMMAKEMARLDRLNIIGSMAATIAHEVRNPLTTVRGYIQYLGRKDAVAEYRETFELMIQELDRANGIISEFLALSKNKALDLRPHDLNGIVSSLAAIVQAQAVENNIGLVLDLQPIPMVVCDDKEIRQLVINLVRNAFEAMSPHGQLTLATAAVNGQASLSVQDTGQGIPEEIIGKVGTPFVSSKEAGTGLGLAICYSIAARIGATIAFQTGPGGTRFTVSFSKTASGRQGEQAEL